LERLLSDSEESGVEASESATPEAATTAGAAEPVDKEPTLDAVATEHPEPRLVGAVGAPEAPATLEAIEEVLGEPAADIGLTHATSSSPTAIMGTTAVSTPESSSPRPATMSPKRRPSQARPAQPHRTHDVPESAVGAVSPEIQEVEKGLGAGLLPEPKEDDAWIIDLVCSTWVAAYEADASDDEDEETATCCSLERVSGGHVVHSTSSSCPRQR
jgi:hypothetical protein